MTHKVYMNTNNLGIPLWDTVFSFLNSMNPIVMNLCLLLFILLICLILLIYLDGSL